MRPIEPSWRVAVVVCCNERSKGSCCGRDIGERLRDQVRDWARSEGLKSEVVVHRGSCMGICGPETTVALHGPGERQLWSVKPGDSELLCAEVRRLVKG